MQLVALALSSPVSYPCSQSKSIMSEEVPEPGSIDGLFSVLADAKAKYAIKPPAGVIGLFPPRPPSPGQGR